MSEGYVTIRKRNLYALALALLVIIPAALAVGALQERPSGFHVYAWVTRVETGETEYLGHHAGSLTNVGKDFVEGKLGDKNFANNTAYAIYGSLSTNSTAFSATWVDIPSEITTGGLERAEMTYASTGAGTWTLTKQWTATDTHIDVQRVGINWNATANSGSLMWADTITPVTLTNGDKLTIVATTQVSG